jgi:hypothetical protein
MILFAIYVIYLNVCILKENNKNIVPVRYTSVTQVQFTGQHQSLHHKDKSAQDILWTINRTDEMGTPDSCKMTIGNQSVDYALSHLSKGRTSSTVKRKLSCRCYWLSDPLRCLYDAMSCIELSRVSLYIRYAMGHKTVSAMWATGALAVYWDYGIYGKPVVRNRCTLE